ncbi:protein of unknown function [Microbacterium sp. Nx66]|nr:protein of unknown function [Microbacterium sp. Nx66]
MPLSRSLKIPPSFQSVAHAIHVVLCAEDLEPIQVRHVTLAADDVAGEAERVAEVGVARGDDPADVTPVALVVEEPDHLLGHGPLLDPAPGTPAVGGGHQDEGLVDDEVLFVPVEGDASGGKPELLDEARGVTRHAREVDQERRSGRDGAHSSLLGFLSLSKGRVGEPVGLRQAGRELVDLVGTEARPVVLVGDDDGRLHVAERLDLLQRRRVLRQVVNLVLDALGIQGTVGRVALDAGRLGVHRDRHLNPSNLWFLRQTSAGISILHIGTYIRCDHKG